MYVLLTITSVNNVRIICLARTRFLEGNLNGLDWPRHMTCGCTPDVGCQQMIVMACMHRKTQLWLCRYALSYYIFFQLFFFLFFFSTSCVYPLCQPIAAANFDNLTNKEGTRPNTSLQQLPGIWNSVLPPAIHLTLLCPPLVPSVVLNFQDAFFIHRRLTCLAP